MKKNIAIVMSLVLSQASLAGDISRDYSTELKSESDRVTFELGYPGMNDTRTECVYVTPTLSNGSIPTRDQFNTAAFSTNFAVLDRTLSIKPILSKGTLIYRLRSVQLYITPVSFLNAQPGQSFNDLILAMNHSQQEIKVLLKRGACTKN